ncbi:unnamed protein product, partial [Brachionus calyciflorus]
EEILERLNTIDQSILDDKNLIKYTTDKNLKLKEINDSFSESLHLEKTLKDVSKDYLRMSKVISGIFDALKMLSLIEPHYFVNWSLFKQMLLSNIDPIKREKGPMGAARATQIEIYCLKLFYDYLASSMTKQHFKIFLFLHSILLSDLNQKKKKNEIDLNHEKLNSIFKMLSSALNDNNNCANDDQISKPINLTHSSWTSFKSLECFSSFKDLTRSLSLMNDIWTEYFHMSTKQGETQIDITDRDIDLINNCPLDNELSIIEKLALWICYYKKDNLSDIITKFNVYNLGGLIPSRSELNLKKAFDISSTSVPILISTPRENAYVSVSIEIGKLAKEINEDIRVVILSLGDDDNKIKRLGYAIKESIKNGSWVIVENVHLLKNWTSDVLKLLYDIKDSNCSQEEMDLWDDYSLNIPENRSCKSKDKKIDIHENFRLWLLADLDHLSNIPDSLIFDCVKLVAEKADMKETYLKCVKNIEIRKTLSAQSIEEASILHSLMCHEEFRNKYEWHAQDFYNYLKALKDIDELTQGSDHDLEYIQSNILNDMIYSVQMTDYTDINLAKKIIQQIIMEKKYEPTQLLENSDKFYSIIEKKSESKKLLNDLKNILEVLTYDEKLTKYNGQILEIPQDLEKNITNILELVTNGLSQIDDILTKSSDLITTSFSMILIKEQLNKYKKYFVNLKQNLNDSLNCIKGINSIGQERIYNFINEINADFFETSEKLVNNSLELSEIYFDIYMESKAIGKELTLNKINLDLLIEPSDFMKKICIERFSSALKEAKKKVFKNEITFRLEVIEDSNDATDSNCIYIENISLINASYDLMSKSFVSTSKKSLLKIPIVKLIQLVECSDDDTLKCIPLIDSRKNELICAFCIKFWQNKSSSLSSTLSNNQQQSNSPINTPQTPIYYPIFFQI